MKTLKTSRNLEFEEVKKLASKHGLSVSLSQDYVDLYISPNSNLALRGMDVTEPTSYNLWNLVNHHVTNQSTNDERFISCIEDLKSL